MRQLWCSAYQTRRNARVPLYILGSSLFGAPARPRRWACAYAFASHLAPQVLAAAVATDRREFRPSAQLGAPYVIARVNVLAADTVGQAQEKPGSCAPDDGRRFVRAAQNFTDEEADLLLQRGAGERRR